MICKYLPPPPEKFVDFQHSEDFSHINGKPSVDLQNKTLPMPIVKEIFKGKTVAIVGNANSIFNDQFGKEIDNNELVVRMNKGFIKDSKAQGTKTSIWASSYHLTETKVNKYFAPQICMWMTPKLNIMPNYSNIFLKMMFIHPEKIWRMLYSKLNNTRPTTGLMVVNFIINYTEAKSVTLFGFDFFKTRTFYESKIRKNTPHNFELEEQLVFSMIKNNSRLTISKNTFIPDEKTGLVHRFLDLFR